MLKHRFQIEVPTIPAGTQVVTKVQRNAEGKEAFIKAGSVGVVLTAPGRVEGLYRVRTPDGREAEYRREELAIRKREVDSLLYSHQPPADELEAHIVYECVVGSRAYGLATEASDEDRRGIYVAPPELLWSLWGAPEQIEDPEEDRVYWELGKFLHLALKANPNVLETLWTPLVRQSSWISDELRALREAFLSKQVFKTFGGYAISQFQKMSADVRQQGHYRPKHALHLIRLLLVGTHLLRTGDLLLDMAVHRDRLLPILDGHLTLDDLAAWRRELEAEFNAAYEETALPEEPDVERVNGFLLKVRRWSVEQRRP
jgi:predicted nucleotidyltransferase